jgi:hypothetical protein
VTSASDVDVLECAGRVVHAKIALHSSKALFKFQHSKVMWRESLSLDQRDCREVDPQVAAA